MSWAADNWHLLKARAVVLGVIARVGGPSSLLGLDPDTFLALLEGVVREDPALVDSLDGLYAEAKAASAPPPPPVSRAERNNEIARLARLFGR